MNEADIKILISCHKPCEYVKNDILQPIQVGAALSDRRLDGMLYDDTGDNISTLNKQYCELTAQYWAWKNLKADYYGFCHYRRYFSFIEQQFPEDFAGNVVEPYLTKNVLKKYGNTEKEIRNLVGQYDIITTTIKDVGYIDGGYSSVYEHYKEAPFLHIKDLDTLLRIIDEMYPDFSDTAKEYINSRMTCFCNMFIMRRDLFFDYASWMFSVLEEFVRRTDMSRYSTEALRTPGHLSERLFNIWCLQQKKNHSELKWKELQCVLFEHTDPERKLEPAFDGDAVPVVFAANNAFVPMFATCMQSVIDHADAKTNYDLVLLHTDISNDNQKTLLHMVEKYPNVSLRIFDVGWMLVNYNLKANAHISVETYYRFLIQDILPDYEKILYLDCDLIAMADVAELYRTDIDGYMLAAVHDADFLGQINGANSGTQKYIHEDFLMKDAYSYFQAGVLLFNEKEMRAAYALDKWLTFASHPYMYNDQDVLNLYCEGRVKYLDMAWNLITDCDHTRIKCVVAYAPDDIQAEYNAAHDAPKLIHYAGFKKPWHNPTEDYAREFWTVARRTPYYEELICRMTEYMANNAFSKKNDRKNKKIKLRDALIRTGEKLFPPGSPLRAPIRKLARKILKYA